LSQETIVVALGGNAILQANQAGTTDEQYANVAATARHIAAMVRDGYRVVVTHGNGPQVGNILIQNEEARAIVPPMPLDVCGAQTQGQIGYWFQRALANALRAGGVDRPVVSLVTQVVVDAADPAFANPTKPVGPFYSEGRARRLMDEKGYIMKETGPQGWRRVVPSPEPRAIVERDAIRTLTEAGVIVICAGGGGIPVCRGADGDLTGVEAVIDKDLAGERLASDVGASVFLMVTDVEQVALDFGRPTQRGIDRMTVAEARVYQKEGHFRPGSMGPKIEAATRFVEADGCGAAGAADGCAGRAAGATTTRRAVIAGLRNARKALSGEAGTTITRA
jgi:carbamate kinase